MCIFSIAATIYIGHNDNMILRLVVETPCDRLWLFAIKVFHYLNCHVALSSSHLQQTDLTILMKQLLGSGNVCLVSTGPLNYCAFSFKEVFTHLNSVEHLGFALCSFSGISPCAAAPSIVNFIKVHSIVIVKNTSFCLDLAVHSGCFLLFNF